MRVKLREKLEKAQVRLYSAAVDRAAHAFARVRYAMPDAHPKRLGLVLHRDIAYTKTDKAHHRLDVYVPTRPKRPLPVVMYVHGGGFTMLSKETHRVMAMAIARAGYLVFNINYRLGPKYRYPAPLEDACHALRWVHEHCAKYGGDPENLSVAGESAGGNLVTALAVCCSWRRPESFARELFDTNVRLRAVVATYGFLDLGHTREYLANPRMAKWAKALLLDAAEAYLGKDIDRAVRECELASPLRIIEAGKPDRPLPPFMASVGTKDPLMRCSKRLKAALDHLGTPCVLHVSPGEIHGYDAMVWRPEARAKWRAVYAFLEEHMKPAKSTGAHAHGARATG